MESITQAMNLMFEKFWEENGKDANFEEGDTITGVFNDGIVILEKENSKTSIKVLAGKPNHFDFDLNLLEKE